MDEQVLSLPAPNQLQDVVNVTPAQVENRFPVAVNNVAQIAVPEVTIPNLLIPNLFQLV